MITDHLKFSPEILQRLGEELNPHPDQGILELVRNSYDADSISCSIWLENTEQPGGTVIISDDGMGMDADEITNGWLLIGKSSKIAQRRTRSGRLTVGNKGLGRLAALRMGSTVSLQTRPKDQPDTQYDLLIEWDRYEAVTAVEQVELSVTAHTPTLPMPCGTRIVIANLTKSFNPKDIHRLGRALILLSDPFESKTGFKPVLHCKEFTGLQKLIKEKYFGDAEYHLSAEVNAQGLVSAKLMAPNGRVRWSASHEEISPKSIYRCPAASFEVWMFLLKGRSFVAKESSLSEVRSWLAEYGGIHLYHRGLRVQPYGDPGHDWLDMNLARARSPEERPSTNNSIGRIVIEDVHEVLVQKTDRTGFVETEPFFELRRFAQDVLNWLADVRLKESEKRREQEKHTVRHGLKIAKAGLAEVLKSVPKASRPSVQQALESYEKARARQIQTLRAEIQLYRTLSTVGTTYAVFAHELAGPGRRIKKLADLIDMRARKKFGSEQYTLDFKDPLSALSHAADDLTTFPNLALRLLERDKRKQGRIKLHDAIHNIVALLKPFINMYKATITLQMADADPIIFGSIAAIESITTNLIINALNAFTSEYPSGSARNVVVKTQIAGEEDVIVRVLDDGPGINKLSIEEIWLPGRTTSPDGTGLGLTIVRDSVVDMGGRVTAEAHGELGGAEFVIRLPLADNIGRE